MIRLLQEQDRTNVLEFLYKEPAINIFIIGDIEAYGFDKDFQKVYADIDEFGNYKSVLLFYYVHSVFYSKDEFFNTDYLELFKQYNPVNISGKTSFIDKVFEYIDGYIKKSMYFLEANKTLFDNDYNADEVVILKNENQFEMLYECLSYIDEFDVGKTPKDQFIKEKLTSVDQSTVLAIIKENKVVSTVTVTAETKKSAMVIGVATLEDYRDKGYASLLMKTIMDKYINKLHKTLALFYDNPNAGAIYKRLGFVETYGYTNLHRE